MGVCLQETAAGQELIVSTKARGSLQTTDTHNNMWFASATEESLVIKKQCKDVKTSKANLMFSLQQKQVSVENETPCLMRDCEIACVNKG